MILAPGRRVPLRTPFPPGHRQPSQLLPFLGVHADHRVTAGLVVFDLLVDIPELRIPVGMLGALQGLGIGLQAEASPAQQPSHRRSRDPMPLPGQLPGQAPQRLGRPPQRRLRITPFIRLVDQGQQRGDQPGIQLPGTSAAPARASGPAIRERIVAILELEDTPAHRGLAHPSDPGDSPNPAMPQQPGLRRQQQPPLPLVQVRRQHLEPQRELIAGIRRDRHTATSNTKSRPTTLFPYSFLEPRIAVAGGRACRVRATPARRWR